MSGRWSTPTTTPLFLCERPQQNKATKNRSAILTKRTDGLSVQVVFLRACHHEPTLLPAVYVPATPAGFMGLVIGGPHQVSINYFPIKEDPLFPVLDAEKSFLSLAEPSHIVAAEGLEVHEFAGKQND